MHAVSANGHWLAVGKWSCSALLEMLITVEWKWNLLNSSLKPFFFFLRLPHLDAVTHIWSLCKIKGGNGMFMPNKTFRLKWRWRSETCSWDRWQRENDSTCQHSLRDMMFGTVSSGCMHTRPRKSSPHSSELQLQRRKWGQGIWREAPSRPFNQTAFPVFYLSFLKSFVDWNIVVLPWAEIPPFPLSHT